MKPEYIFHEKVLVIDSDAYKMEQLCSFLKEFDFDRVISNFEHQDLESYALLAETLDTFPLYSEVGNYRDLRDQLSHCRQVFLAGRTIWSLKIFIKMLLTKRFFRIQTFSVDESDAVGILKDSLFGVNKLFRKLYDILLLINHKIR